MRRLIASLFSVALFVTPTTASDAKKVSLEDITASLTRWDGQMIEIDENMHVYVVDDEIRIFRNVSLFQAVTFVTTKKDVLTSDIVYDVCDTAKIAMTSRCLAHVTLAKAMCEVDHPVPAASRTACIALKVTLGKKRKEADGDF